VPEIPGRSQVRVLPTVFFLFVGAELEVLTRRAFFFLSFFFAVACLLYVVLGLVRVEGLCVFDSWYSHEWSGFSS
jgi:hypothetical protein